MEGLLDEVGKLQKGPNLVQTAGHVDGIIDLLEDARRDIVDDPNSAPTILAKLQNLIKNGFENVDESIKITRKAIDKYGKALNKKLPKQALSSSYDALASHPSLINRAIAMHLLREGHFNVASIFLSEALSKPSQPSHTSITIHTTPDASEFTSTKSEELQTKFTNMYSILHALLSKNLLPAIEWARINSEALGKLGSNLEFELSKLQFIWLFQGPAINGLPNDDKNGLSGALRHARAQFPRFQQRYLRDIQQLVTAMAYQANLYKSPYNRIFDTESAWSDISAFFTREFCSLLGLSAFSPLYVATTAGAIALPTLLKLADIVKTKRTEWTTQDELPVEITLPKSMLFHPIFVCPVSKEQTTEANPPMMMPCGHVVAKESLARLSKGARFKCPYCPNESEPKDAREIVL